MGRQSSESVALFVHLAEHQVLPERMESRTSWMTQWGLEFCRNRGAIDLNLVSIQALQ